MSRIAVTLAAVRAALTAPDFQERVADVGAVSADVLTALAVDELAARAVDLSDVDLTFGFRQDTRRLVVTVTPKKRRRRQEHRPAL